MSATGTASSTDRVHATLVLVRHGESVWNRSMRLTGWADVPLCDRGREQARKAGRDLRARGITVDACYSSLLCRATETSGLLLEALAAAPSRHQSWRINERHYGAMQGLHWWQAIWRFGPGSVLRCRRDFDARPPLLPAPATPPGGDIPPADLSEWRNAQRGESLADALERFMPIWVHEIAPALRSGRCVLIVAHNNLLRALIRQLEGGSGRPAPPLPPAQPWILELDTDLRLLRKVRV
jgi:2,3-bisphosphoglycerate-dependent phosphoglycerate mutase